ncbi:hypothetical protein HMPREF3156_01320, partial [Neisseria sp. HMSC06F02]
RSSENVQTTFLEYTFPITDLPFTIDPCQFQYRQHFPIIPTDAA